MTDNVLESNRLNPKLTKRLSLVKPLLEKDSSKQGTDRPHVDSNTTNWKTVTQDETLRHEEGTITADSYYDYNYDDDEGINKLDNDDGFINIDKKKEQPFSLNNVPMLLTWLYKHFDEMDTAIAGLEFTLKHANTGDGCVLLLKYGVLSTLFMIQRHDGYKDNKEVQLLCVKIFQQLLQCNYTREPLIITTEVLKTTFSIGHRFMASSDHVLASILCMLQCARSEINRDEIVKLNLTGYCSNFCKLHSKQPLILSSILKLFYWVANNDERMTLICEKSALETTLQCMKRHMCNAEVLKPGIRFLTRACSIKWCLEYILKKNAVALIITALRALHNEAELQSEGLKMLQTLSKSKNGYKQICETKGGWQSICQGTTLGNVLLHDLKGEFNNPGWCIGDTPVPTILDKTKIATMAMSQSTLKGPTQSLWTCRALMEYMGLSMNGRTLGVTMEVNRVYFELISSLDLLPHSAAEDRGTWFARLSVFEFENSILINDMVTAIIEMKKKDLNKNKNGKNVDIGEDGLETLKPVFVNGILVNMQSLAELDVNAVEALQDAGVL